MDIQAEKIELAKLILNTNDTGLINKIRSLFKKNEEDWLTELPEHIQKEISASIEQADRGEFITYEQVQKEISDLFKK